MNFFAHQDQARRNSLFRRLLVTIAVLFPVLIWAVSSAWSGTFYWQLLLLILGVMLPFIAGGYWHQRRKLKKGGSAIAQRFGGVLVSLEPEAGNYRLLLDIVEEMALASGSRVPLVYVMNQRGINAFSAGRTAEDSVICVTGGALIMLNREEMQAIVAHLFSQIHHNDMRSDAQMTGVFSGIIWFTCLLLPIAVAGIINGCFFLVGGGWTYLTYFAISRFNRERKFLADATAAQFTRNPQSVASVLKKIGGHESGSFLGCCEQTEEFLSMFFAAPFHKVSLHRTSPYPPLDKRIERLDPEWDGEYPDVPPLDSLMGDDEQACENRRRWEVLGAVSTALRGLNSVVVVPSQLYQTQVMLARIPAEVRSATRHPSGAQALIYRLMLSTRTNLQAEQVQLLQGMLNQEVGRYLQLLDEPMRDLDRYLRLPLLDLCIPALRQLASNLYKRFTRNLLTLATVDHGTCLVNWSLIQILDTQVQARKKINSRYTLDDREADITLLLRVLALTGNRSAAQSELAYYRACEVLPFYTAPAAELSDDWLEPIEEALKKLQQLKPQDKEILMEAVAVCIENDGHITCTEIEVARAIADILDCPMPEGLETPSLESRDETPLLT